MSAERRQVYQDRVSLGAFLRGNALNIELHRLYDVYLKNNKHGSLRKLNELMAFNEVYYRCTCIHSLEQNLSIDKAFVERWFDDFETEIGSRDTAEFLSCLVLGVFSVIHEHSSQEKDFCRHMRTIIGKSEYYNKVNTQISEFKKHFGYVTIDLSWNGSCAVTPIPLEIQKETEEYKQIITEMKRELGKSYIRLDTIAECILRFPTFDMQYKAYQEISALLTGTAWSTKAEEVLKRMFEKLEEQQAQQDKLADNMEKAVSKPTQIGKVDQLILENNNGGTVKHG